MNSEWRRDRRGLQAALIVLGTVVLATSRTLGASVPVAGPVPQVHAVTADATLVGNQEQRADQGVLYDPSRVYAGVYASDRVYRLVLGSEQWAGSRHPARVREVTCREARNALAQGAWRGQLNANGACGSGEPTEWATGNFLNFQSGLHDDAAL